MTKYNPDIDWRKTTFDGSRREQLRRARAMTVRQRLEALDELCALSERMHAMFKQMDAAGMMGSDSAACLARNEFGATARSGKAHPSSEPRWR